MASWAVIFLPARLKPCLLPYPRTPQRLPSPCETVLRQQETTPHFPYPSLRTAGATASLCWVMRSIPLRIVYPSRDAAKPSQSNTVTEGMQSAKLEPPFLQQALPQHQTTQRLPLQNRSICIHETTGFAILQKGYSRPTVGLRLSIYPVKITPACHSIVNAILPQATFLPPSPSTRAPDPMPHQERSFEATTQKLSERDTHRIVIRPWRYVVEGVA